MMPMYSQGLWLCGTVDVGLHLEVFLDVGGVTLPPVTEVKEARHDLCGVGLDVV